MLTDVRDLPLTERPIRLSAYHRARVQAELPGRSVLGATPMAIPGQIVDFACDGVIVGQGERATHSYQVVAGCVRILSLTPDGRRQVAEFFLAGDVFGWEAGADNEFAAEAVNAVRLRRARLDALEERIAADPVFARSLHHVMARQMRAARARLVLLGRKTAIERVASFLIDMRQRLSNLDPSEFVLPMGRADIADYLGLTTETVCRCLTELRRKKVLELDRSFVCVLNPAALLAAEAGRLF